VTGQRGGREFTAEAAASSGGDAHVPEGKELSALILEVETSHGGKWRIVLAVETAALPSLLPKRVSEPSTAASRRKPGIDDAPFAELPLSVGARLVDMAMPLHRLASIEPGAVLPIMVARSVPLQAGEIVIARGTVGEVDDQVALQITQTFTGKETQ
jgi:flagellar motor switch protein FliM